MESFGGARKSGRPDGATGNGGLAGSKWSRGRGHGYFDPPPQPAAASFSASCIMRVSVDASLAGIIISKGGADTEHMRQVTGAKLSICDNESDANLKDIELEGDFDQIIKAHAMVQELIMDISASCTFGDQCHLAHGAAELRKDAA